MPARILFSDDLPVSARREEIARAIEQHQVVVVAGETGSGKTTQLPKIAMTLGRERIAHTQPRRIAARTIAERIAEELDEPLGQTVGYRVRFDDATSRRDAGRGRGSGRDARRDARRTPLTVMTDGILLAELTHDRDLAAYDTIIIDEAHERSLTIDFLLGYLRRLLPRRPDLKVIITSATIDPASFAAFFADAAGEPAPVVEVSGRTYPVEVRYRPLATATPPPSSAHPSGTFSPSSAPGGRKSGHAARGGAVEEGDLASAVFDALAELERDNPGDVLVFLSGEGEIRDVQEALTGRLDERTEVLPLYGRLSAADQHRVFEPSTRAGVRRRVVLATNVAETSLTVPGIRSVIDAGQARISRYSTRSKVQRLPIEAISQASAKQRAGRAGRTAPGIAIRLYAEDDYERRPEFTEPEIRRTNLAAVLLQMLSLQLGAIEQFPFLTPPDSRGVKDGLDLLTELGALDAHGRITKTGRDLTRLPVDPRLGRMVIESRRHGVEREVIAIVAGLSILDPRERPLEQRAQADQQHARFTEPGSDFLSLLKLWNHLEEQSKQLSGTAFRRLCRREYLNYLRVREWQDLERQLRRAASSIGVRPGEPKAAPDAVHKSLLAGLLSNLAERDEARAKRGTGGRTAEGEYLGARGRRIALWPGSALAKKKPAAIMAAELVETSRLFARTVAAIDLAWAEPLAGDLAKRSYSEPHWERKLGAVVGFERVLLFGLSIVARRRIQWSRVNLPEARELFIRHALVDGDWDSKPAFERQNRKLRERLAEREERERRRDLLESDEAVFAFYDARIPAGVASMRDFEGWWRTERAEHPELLTMTESDLLGDAQSDADDWDEDAFPSRWLTPAGAELALRYRFEPGADDDGVTVLVPLEQLPALSPDGFDWLVPGLREELATAIIKALPKHIRRHVVPAADWARRLLPDLPQAPDGARFADRLGEAVRRAAFTPMTADDVEWARVPEHLRMRFAATDARGRIVDASRDLADLQRRVAPNASARVAQVVAAAHPSRSPLERDGLTAMPADPIPRVVHDPVTAYPGLSPVGDGVGVRVFATESERNRAHRLGTIRLLERSLPSPLSYVREHLTRAETLSLARSPYPSTDAFFADAQRTVLAARVDAVEPVFDAAAFDALRVTASESFMDELFAIVQLAARVLEAAREAEKAISGASSMAFIAPLSDMRGQLAALVFPGFLSATGAERLRRLPVYLAGIRMRVERLVENPQRDRSGAVEIDRALQRFTDAGGTLPLASDTSANLVRARWLLEELRISLFAQQLGAAETVSVQRVQKALAG